MEKTLLAIYGTSDIGKTTSIKNFYLKFISKYSSQVINNNSLCDDDSNEMYRIIELQNGVKIGVCSYGDDGTSYDILDDFAKQDCKVIVCASRTKGASVDSINKLIEELNETNSTLKDELEKINNEIQDLNKNMNNYEIKWIHKSYFWDNPDYYEEKILNDSFSESILELVEYYMVQ